MNACIAHGHCNPGQLSSGTEGITASKLRAFRYAICWAVFVMAALVSVNRLNAQSSTGIVTGTVTDPSGSVIKGAIVTATDTQRKVNFVVKTDKSGLYRVSMPIGTYTIRISAPGFSTLRQAPFELELAQVDRFDFSLKIGEARDVVEVTAESPLLKQETAQVDTVIDQKTEENLPLATRNYVELTLLVPGSTHPDPASLNTVQSQQTAGRPFINGNNEQSNNFLLDGLENNQLSDNLLGYVPSPDAIQEFTVITQNPSAQYGNFEGGTITTAIRSGTNEYHGRLYEFVRNDIFNATPWGLTSKPKLRWNMFGGTLGGPLLHNKLFFFGDFQAQRFDIPNAPAFATILTPLMRTGNFSELIPGSATATNWGVSIPHLSDPSTYGDPSGARAPLAGYNLANIKFPTAAFPGVDAVARTLFASGLYPQPTTSQHLINNYTYSTRTFTNVDQGDVKLDYALSARDHIFARASKSYTTNPIINSWVLQPNTYSNDWADGGIAGWTHVITPSILNDVRFGVMYTKIHYGVDMGNLGNLATNLGIANGNTSYGKEVAGLPSIKFGSYFTPIGSTDTTALFADTSLQFDDSVTITHGRHSITTGFQYRRYRINTFFSTTGGEAGSLTYSGTWTSPTGKNRANKGGVGLGAADFVYGAPSSEGRGANNGTWGQRATVLAGFVQDDWRATDSLTLNLGLRYDTHLPWVEVNDKQVNFDLQTGRPVYPAGGKQAAALNTLYAQYNPETAPNRATYDSYNLGWDFQPRIGFAWTPEFLGKKTVLRGAVSITSYMQGTGTNLRITENAPFVNNFNYSALGDPNDSPSTQKNGPNGGYFNTENGFPANLTPNLSDTGLRIWDPHIRPSVDVMYNLSIQHQLSKHDTVQLGYVGQKVTHIMVPMDYAQFIQNADGSVSPGPFLGEKMYDNTTTASIFQVPDSNPNNQGAFAYGAASVGNQTYNSLQAVYQHRFGSNLEAQANYTYSKCMADNIGYYGSAHGQSQPGGYYRQDQYNQKAEWGPCYYDVTHLVSAYVVYTLPFGKGQAFGRSVSAPVNEVIGGWQLSVINIDHTGFANTAIDYNNYSNAWNNFPAVTPRADCDGPVHYVRKYDPIAGGMRFWDSTNFADAASATGFGSCSNGTIRGPGESTFDMGLEKMFGLPKQTSLQFRVEAVNLFNHPIFQAPQPDYSTGDQFGVAYSYNGNNPAESERQVQFAVKLLF
jgi:hypothetical protein